jgi:SPP1 family predicted phage head-tail adaptor
MRTVGGQAVPFIRSGQLNRLVTFQAPVDDSDSFGQSLPFFADRFQAWAALDPYQGHEAAIAKQQRQTLSHKITIRWPGSQYKILPTWRIVYQSNLTTRYFNIVEIRNIADRNAELAFICEEVLNPGGPDH